MKRIYWKLFSAEHVNQVVFEIPRIINRYGIIINSSLLSDYCMNFMFEIEHNEIIGLKNDLGKYLSDCDWGDDISEGSCIVFLNLRFINSTGDVKNKIPNVPG